MTIDEGKLFNTWDDLCSMVFDDLIKFVQNLLTNEKLSKNEVAEILNISINDVDKLLYNEFPDVKLETYLLVLVLNDLTLDVHTIKAPYDHSSGKSKYDNIEKKLHEKKNEFLDALNQCKPDSKYLQQLRELARTNAGNEKLCKLIKYYSY